MVGAIDVEAEIKKLTEELIYTEGFLKSVQKKLSNERFVNNAPEQVVASEKKKEADALAKIETIKASLASMQ
jgi:valyl-tRNA synthetase